jgi:hypothetical protein
VKLAFNVLLFDGKGLRKKWPEVMGIALLDDAGAKRDPNSRTAQCDGLLTPGWEDPKRLRETILEKHSALRKAFGRGLGDAEEGPGDHRRSATRRGEACVRLNGLASWEGGEEESPSSSIALRRAECGLPGVPLSGQLDSSKRGALVSP